MIGAFAAFALPLLFGLWLFPVETVLFVVFAFAFVLAGIWVFERVLGKTAREQYLGDWKQGPH